MKLIHDLNRTSQFLFLAKKPASINNSKTQSTRKFYESKIKRSKDQEAHQHNIVNKSKHTEKKKQHNNQQNSQRRVQNLKQRLGTSVNSDSKNN